MTEEPNGVKFPERHSQRERIGARDGAQPR
jgi:hypothetical protein